MFAENHSSGKHMVCDIRNIQNTVLLNNKDQLKNLLKTICSAANVLYKKAAEQETSVASLPHKA